MTDEFYKKKSYAIITIQRKMPVKKQEILKKIEETERQIKSFKKRLQSSDLCEDLYDNAVLQKAILLKELEACDKNSVIEGIKKGMKKLIPNKKKVLICDYFK